MKNRNIRLAFNYEGDIVPNEYGKMGKSKDSSGLDSFSSPLSVGDMLDVQIFIKTGSLLTLSLNPPVSLSSEFRDKRRERQKLVFSPHLLAWVRPMLCAVLRILSIRT